MPSFKKKYKLFLWILDIREIYIKLFTKVIKLFTNYAQMQMEEQRADLVFERQNKGAHMHDHVV